MRALKIARIGGIPIRVHWSFVLALPLFAALWSLSLTIGLFVSVLLHELAHAIYARRHGARVEDIVLLPIGGVSRIARPPRLARHEALMALAGPLTSLALGGLGLLGYAMMPASWSHTRLLTGGLGQLNILLGVFNLLPAFPMDGGRVLRAGLSGRMGPIRATRVAATVGKVFAALFAAAGLVFTDLILVAIGAFVWFGATAEERETELENLMSRVRVRDLMTTGVHTIPGEWSVNHAAEQLVRDRLLAEPVIEASGQVLGVLGLREVKAVPDLRRDQLRAADAARAAPAVSPDDGAWQALRAMGESRVPMLPVIEGGELVGAIEQAAILEDAQLRQMSQFQRRA